MFKKYKNIFLKIFVLFIITFFNIIIRQNVNAAFDINQISCSSYYYDESSSSYGYGGCTIFKTKNSEISLDVSLLGSEFNSLFQTEATSAQIQFNYDSSMLEFVGYGFDGISFINTTNANISNIIGGANSKIIFTWDNDASSVDIEGKLFSLNFKTLGGYNSDTSVLISSENTAIYNNNSSIYNFINENFASVHIKNNDTSLALMEIDYYVEDEDAFYPLMILEDPISLSTYGYGVEISYGYGLIYICWDRREC